MITATQHKAAATLAPGIFAKGGLLEQAQAAQAGGTLADFLKQLLTTFGPYIGPLIIGLISQLLHIPVPPAPAPGPVNAP